MNKQIDINMLTRVNARVNIFLVQFNALKCNGLKRNALKQMRV